MEGLKHEFIAKYGSKAHQTKLLDDHYAKRKHVDKRTRRIIAEKGDHDHLDKMVHDVDDSVRYHVAWKGGPRHWDHMLNDSDERVRLEIAQKGEHNHIDHLMKDEHEGIRNVAGLQKKVLNRRDGITS